ncbi:MAG: glycosyltransferase [Deltaproteobacteria bacterium]|jgi:rhamnosyltransferase|nr:glycosyltransferase [Deltaproteobacteria bacterium]
MKYYKIYGVVILYHPEPNVLKNIGTYINGIERLYVIDNSEIKDLELIEKIKDLSTKITYIDNNGNKGIACALNIGAQLAIEDGATWILTMDQDSRFEKESLQVLIKWITSNDTEKVGIISPYHLINNISYKSEDRVIDKLTVITSGNLLNLEVYKKIGPFEEKYFIDSVDHEYCLRLRKNAFLIKVH